MSLCITGNLEMIKKAVLFLFLAVVALADIILYRGNYLYYQATERTANLDRKIRLLEKGQTGMTWNSLLALESAKTYFERGVIQLGDPNRRDDDFRRAYDCFLQSLSLNPLSAAAHFYFAQALQYMEFVGLPVRENSLDEYKKSARLSGQDAEIFAAAGKALLSRWPSLSSEDQQMALDIVRSSLAGKDLAKTRAVLELWFLHIRDYAVIEKVLPQDAAVDRLFAQFLGERSLSREERVRVLSRAEELDFRRAKNDAAVGQAALSLFHIQEAAAHLKSALAGLQGVFFYQNLANQSPIDPLEFNETLKAVLLALAKCRIEESRKIEGALNDLRSYLKLEDQLAGATNLENFLKERSLIGDRAGSSLKNLSVFSFELLLAYKQNRYRDIIQAGQALESSVLVVPQGVRGDYADILELVGDACQKLDDLYESNNFYKKASDLQGPNIVLLAKMMKNFERLNDLDGLKTVGQAIQRIIEAGLPASEETIPLGDAYLRKLSLDGRKYRLNLIFSESASEPLPFLSVFFNGLVVWEDYLQGHILSLDLASAVGDNTLRIQALNIPLKILRLSLTSLEDPATVLR